MLATKLKMNYKSKSIEMWNLLGGDCCIALNCAAFFKITNTCTLYSPAVQRQHRLHSNTNVNSRQFPLGIVYALLFSSRNWNIHILMSSNWPKYSFNSQRCKCTFAAFGVSQNHNEWNQAQTLYLHVRSR